MGRVFVCGDIHGASDISKLWGISWPEGRSLSRDDHLIILGDFGLIWSDPAAKDAAFWLDWLECRPWTTLFIDGNHENHDLIDALPVSEWHGGKVHVLPNHPHLIHLMRGQAYTSDSHGTWFTMGGARSQDRQWRTEGRTWWSREMPSDEEYETALASLERIAWQPDYVFTHDCPSSLLRHAMPWFLSHPEYTPETDRLTDFLQYADDHLDHRHLRRWYSGHYHHDTVLGNDPTHVVLFRQIVELGDLPVVSAASDDFIPGVGRPPLEVPQTPATVREREQATEEQMAIFVRDRLKLAEEPTTLDYERQQIFRRWLRARRAKDLMARGPHADVL
jgi:hypothetical protein